MSPGVDHQTGNTHARRLLDEAAWRHLQPYRTPGATMRARWELAPVAARDRGHAGNQRLHQRWLHFTDRKKDPGSRERRDRPRAGRLVLVPGRHGRLTVGKGGRKL